MIFTPSSIEKIKSGQKTETRRIWKRPHVKVGGVYGTRASRRDKETGSTRIRVTEVRQEFLGDVDSGATHREGFSSVEDFMAVWKQLHGEWNPKQTVYVVRFEVVP